MDSEKIFISQKFNTDTCMRETSANWHYLTTYTLLPHAFEGENSLIFLPGIQLSYATRNGGVLYDTASPKGTFSVAVIQKADGKVCFGETKVKKGMIVFFDDKKTRSMFTGGDFKTAVLSFPKKNYRTLYLRLLHHSGEVIEDRDALLQSTLEGALETFRNDPSVTGDRKRQEEMERQIIRILEQQLEDQTPLLPKLTKGEKIALQIRDRVYRRITKKVTIHSLAQEFGVSEQTLQNAFKSLFGMTPNRFLRNLKLNHVRKALMQTDAEHDTVVHIANRWGFTHMGHFSRYYTDLFGENPSLTLQKAALAQTEEADAA